jgi:hypothetical protein
MSRLQLIPNGPPKPASDLLVPHRAASEPPMARVKPSELVSAVPLPLDGAIPEIPVPLLYKAIGSAALILTAATILVAALRF